MTDLEEEEHKKPRRERGKQPPLSSAKSVDPTPNVPTCTIEFDRIRRNFTLTRSPSTVDAHWREHGQSGKNFIPTSKRRAVPGKIVTRKRRETGLIA
jgi:hypothetical protein